MVRMLSIRAVLALLTLWVVACSQEPRPAVAPLAVDDSELQALYQWGAGPWDVGVAPELTVQHGKREGELVFNVSYPIGADGALPVVLFSHGNWSDQNQYDALISHWVSHGYVVLAPLHMDGSGGYVSGTINMIRYGNFGLIQARVDDLITLLDNLDAIAKLLPADAPAMDHQRIVAAGHSFGAFNAQQLGGAAALDEDSGDYVDVLDERILAVVAISPPGPMFDEITVDSWGEQRLPTLMTTGTWDTNAMFWPDWRAHLTSWQTARPGDQYALVIQGADHYLGNLICRLDLENPAQTDALAMVNTTVIAFLDAYAKGDPVALQFLRSSQLPVITGSFAEIKTR